MPAEPVRSPHSPASPFFSIVTPSYNQAAFLERCMQSVLNQPGASFEYIVMDGGSTDGSVEIIRRHQRRLAYWASAPDRGQSDAINQGLGRGRGVYAAWINSDDWYEPGALQKAQDYLEANPSCDVLVGICRHYDALGQVVARYQSSMSRIEDFLCVWSRWLAGDCISQPEAFFRRSLFEQLGRLDARLHYTMDYDLWLRMALAGARFDHLPVNIANFQLHDRQKTRDRARTFAECGTTAERAFRQAEATLPESRRREIAAQLSAYNQAAQVELGSAIRAQDYLGRGKGDPPLDLPAASRLLALRHYFDELAAVEEVVAVEARPALDHTWECSWAAAAPYLNRPRLRVLDYGCGSGIAAEQFLHRLAGRADVELTLADLSPAMLAAAVRRLTKAARVELCPRLVADPGELTGGPFEVILTQTVLVHQPDPGALVDKLLRLLAPAGVYFQLREPNYSFWRNADCVATFGRYVDWLAASVQQLRTAMAPGEGRPGDCGVTELLHKVERTTAAQVNRTSTFPGKLSEWDVFRLVFRHGQPGGIGQRGLELSALVRGTAMGLEQLLHTTSDHLAHHGVVPSQVHPDWRAEAARLAKAYPADGAYASAVWRKSRWPQPVANHLRRFRRKLVAFIGAKPRRQGKERGDRVE